MGQEKWEDCARWRDEVRKDARMMGTRSWWPIAIDQKSIGNFCCRRRLFMSCSADDGGGGLDMNAFDCHVLSV